MFDLTNPKKPTIPKDPDADLDYSEDWTTWLNGDVISSFEVVFPDPDCTLMESGTQPKSTDGSIVTAWLVGGRSGITEQATYRITTVAGRIDDRSLFFKIADR